MKMWCQCSHCPGDRTWRSDTSRLLCSSVRACVLTLALLSQHSLAMPCSTGHQAMSHSSSVPLSQAVCTPMALVCSTCIRSSSCTQNNNTLSSHTHPHTCIVTCVYSPTSSSSLLSSASYLTTLSITNTSSPSTTYPPPCLGSVLAFLIDPALFLGVFLTPLLADGFLTPAA